VQFSQSQFSFITDVCYLIVAHLHYVGHVCVTRVNDDVVSGCVLKRDPNRCPNNLFDVDLALTIYRVGRQIKRGQLYI